MGVERRPADVIRFPVDAVAAIIHTRIAQKHLQKSNTPAVRGETMANTASGSIADGTRGAGTIHAAGRTSHIILGGVG